MSLFIYVFHTMQKPDSFVRATCAIKIIRKNIDCVEPTMAYDSTDDLVNEEKEGEPAFLLLSSSHHVLKIIFRLTQSILL